METETTTTIEELIGFLFKAIGDGDCKILDETLSNINRNYPESLNNLRNNRIKNPLVFAAKAGHLEMIKLMINTYNFDQSSYGSILFADEEDEIMEAPVLWTAATAGRLEIVQYLLSIGCDVNQGTLTNSTPIRGACYDGYTDVVQHLVNNGGNINTTNKNGQSPLLVACGMNRLETVNYLISLGADLDIKALRGLTALHVACERDNVDIIYKLLDAGAKLAQDDDGACPISLAAVNGNDVTICKIMEKYSHLFTNLQISEIYSLLASTLFDKYTSSTPDALKFWNLAMNYRKKISKDELENLRLNRVHRPDVFGDKIIEALTETEFRMITTDESSLIIHSLLSRERILGSSHYVVYFLRVRAANFLDQLEYSLSFRLLDHALELTEKNVSPNINPIKYSDSFLFTLQCHGKAFIHIKAVPTTKCIESLTNNIAHYISDFQASTEIDWKTERDGIFLIKIWLHEFAILLKSNALQRQEYFQLVENLALLKYISRISHYTVLHIACGLETEKTINTAYIGKQWPSADCISIIAQCFDVNARSKTGATPLHLAIGLNDMESRLSVCKLLIMYGAHPDVLDCNNKMPYDLVDQSDAELKNLLWCQISLKCLAAREIRKQKCDDLNSSVPTPLQYFVSMH